jgi:hypothetical protein
MEPVAIWKRAPVAFAIVLLLVGAAVGFGVGYKVGDNGGKSTVKVTSPGTTARKKKLTPAQLKRTQLLACMAKQGVKWPKSPASRISKPAGVSQAKYEAALIACYGAATAVPPKTSTTVRAAGP